MGFAEEIGALVQRSTIWLLPTEMTRPPSAVLPLRRQLFREKGAVPSPWLRSGYPFSYVRNFISQSDQLIQLIYIG